MRLLMLRELLRMLLRGIIRIRRRRHLDKRWAEVHRDREGVGHVCDTYNLVYDPCRVHMTWHHTFLWANAGGTHIAHNATP